MGKRSSLMPATMSNRKFYKTTLILEVLSDEPLGAMPLTDIVYHITEGDMSGDIVETSESAVDGAAMAKLLTAQRSTPEFFGLTEEGEDIDNEEQS